MPNTVRRTMQPYQAYATLGRGVDTEEGGAVEIGRYADGRPLSFTESSKQFDIGGAPVATEDVLAWDRAGQIAWVGDDMRNWAYQFAANVGSGAETPPPKRGWFTRLPTWAKVLFVIFYPVSIPYAVIVMWKDRKYTQAVRVALTAAAGVFLLVVIISANGTEAERLAEQKKTESEAAVKTAGEQAKSVAKDSESSRQAYDLGEMTSPELIKNFVAACGLIGVDPREVKKVKQLPDWASGERYTFMYTTSELKVFANADQTISSINIGDVHVYEQGFEPLKIDDFLVDWDTAMQLRVNAERMVRDSLNYPSTADFPWIDGWGVGRSRDIYYIGGLLSAKNAFGVAKDTSYYIEYQKKGESYTPRYFRLGGENVIGTKSVIPAIERNEVGTASGSKSIVLIEGTLGKYGKSKAIDGDTYIWYYVPPGEYEVTSQTNMTKLYLDKNQTVRNSDGYSECVSVQTESPRVSRRPRRLRGWGHEQTNQVPTGSA